MQSEVYDVAVVGAGPAGASLAIRMNKLGRRVVLVDGGKFPRPEHSVGWVSARTLSFLEDLGIKPGTILGQPLRDVMFHSADLLKTAKPNFDDVVGYVVDRMAFRNKLFESASDCEITTLTGSAVKDILLKENSAVLQLANGEEAESRLLVLASGRGTDLLDRVGVPRERASAPYWTAQIDAPLKDDDRKPQIDVIFGLDKAGSFGVCCVLGNRMSMTINWLGDRDETTSRLAHLCKAAFGGGVAPLDLSAEAAGAALLHSPASLALDMDTHVGKHTLVIGDAGGFVAAASNEGIHPAMWSAEIAAEVLAVALDTRHSQDELMAFDSKWRIKMADYLRSPNTDSQFLLPLVFSNQPMADRMGGAFFFGENI